MITLLLGLFIVLFAMSTINPHKYDNLRRSLSQTFHGQITEEPGGLTDGSTSVLDPDNPAETTNAVAASITQAAQTNQRIYKHEQERLQAIVAQAKLGHDVKVTNNAKGIKLTLAGDALFAPGSSTLNPDVVVKLTRLEHELAKFNRSIEITGHTDGQPFDGPLGNWGLSTDRAAAVAWFFHTLHYPDVLMDAHGLADTHPIVKPPKDDPHASMRKNRRIEITILAPGVNDPRGAAIGVSDVLKHQAAASIRSSNPAGLAAESNDEVEAQLQKEIDSGIVAEITAVSASQQ
jgi:chemotaxis protein MotB